MQRHQDKSSKAEISFEFFMATIDRPWFLGDLFNIQGWYLYQQRKDSISDGTVIGQLYKPDDKNPKLLPMVPKAFVIMRNVKITADDWGDAGTAFSNAQQNAAGSGQSSSNSFGASASYLWYSANMQHADQQSSGAFGQDQSAVTGFVADSTGNGGTLTLMGSQIIGWIGEIQPECPLIDDPTLPKPKTTADPAGAATPAPALGPIPAPAP
jgi:hypothetical protein